MAEEDRIALLPRDIRMVGFPQFLFFERGYGNRLGVDDQEYLDAGANVVSEKVASSVEVMCQPSFVKRICLLFSRVRLFLVGCIW